MAKPINPYEESARRRKAYDFAEHLRARGVTSEHLETMHPTVLAHHARMAGLKSAPSEATMLQVHSHLRPRREIDVDELFNNM
jgi:hypothetical protein